FVSSRRRHTRSKRDWSSDVCSSDLDTLAFRRNSLCTRSICNGSKPSNSSPTSVLARDGTAVICFSPASACAARDRCFGLRHDAEIGRASCRERLKSGGGQCAVELGV